MGLFGSNLFNLTPEQIQKNQEASQKRQAEVLACAGIIDSFFKYNPDEISWIAICLLAAYNDCLLVSPESVSTFDICIFDDKKGQRVYIAERLLSEKIPFANFCNELKKFINCHQYSLSSFAYEAASFFAEKSKDWFLNHTLYAFQYMLHKWEIRSASNTGIMYQSKDMIELVPDLFLPEEGTSLFNPYAGLCPFIVKMAGYMDLEYEAQEISEDNCLLANLNLYFHNCNPICENADSSKKWPEKVFDYIVSVPPFGCPIINQEGEKTTAEIDFLQHAIKGYSRKLVGILSAGICNNANAQLSYIRKTLVDNDELEAVILLPKDTMTNSSVKTIFLIANREKEKKGIVRFVDVSEYDTNFVRDFFYSEDPIDEAIDVSITEIANNNYNLFPPYYLNEGIQDIPSGMKVISLKDILSPLETTICYEDYNDIRVKAEDVNLFGIINAETIPLSTDCENVRHQCISQSCLVVIFSNRFHIGYLKMETPLEVMLPYLSKVFDVRKDSVDPAYLVSEMRKPYFMKQLSRFTAGTTFNRVNSEDLLSCKIVVPVDVMTQAALALKEQEELLKKKGIEIEALYKKKMEEFIIGQRERKHAIAQVLNEIVPTLELLKLYSEKGDSFNWNSVISPRSGKTFGDNMVALQGQIQRVVTMVDNFTNMEKFHPAQKILIEEFISNYCNSKVSLSYKTAFESRLSEPVKVSISQEELTQMLDNLFTNANKYGFTDPERKDYILKVILEDADTVLPMVAIRIMNNGNPASDSISPGKIFVWGEGKGSGIGCWQVKEIAEHFGGSIRFIDHAKETNGFATEFEICLPIIIE